jgi:hypothetical protein
MRLIVSGLLVFAVAVCAAVLSRGPVEACIHGDESFKGSINTDTQEAILFFDKGREELILRADYNIRGLQLPKTVAWVLTLPSEPDAYQTVDSAAFKETMLYSSRKTFLAVPSRSPKRERPGEQSVDDVGVELGKKVTVGPYEIQPIRGVGDEAAKGVNDWFKKNGFNEVPEKHLAYFTANKFTFLCVKITPQNNSTTGIAKGELDPLHVSFATEKPYYPVKFFAFQGNFSLNLVTLTRQDLDIDRMTPLERLNSFPRQRNVRVPFNEVAAASLNKLLPGGKAEWAKGDWKLNYLQCSNFNPNKDILDWKEDLFLTMKAD